MVIFAHFYSPIILEHALYATVYGIFVTQSLKKPLSGIRFQDSGFRFQVSGLRFQASGFRTQVSALSLSEPT